MLIINWTMEENIMHISYVLESLQKNKLFSNLNQCTFMRDKSIYLGIVISKDVLKMDIEKIKEIVILPSPTNILKLQVFMV